MNQRVLGPPDARGWSVTVGVRSDRAADEHVRIALARQLVSQLTRSHIPVAVGIVGIVLALSPQVGRRAMLGWGAVALVDHVRAILGTRARRRRLDRGDPDPHFVAHQIPHFVSFGLVWGSLPLVAGRYGTERGMWFAIVVVLATITMLLVVSASSRILYTATMVSVVAMLAIGAAWRILPGGYFVPVVLMYVAIGLYLQAILQRTVVANVRSSYENALMASQLSRVLEQQDPLTRLLNRTGLRAWLDREIALQSDAAQVAVAVGNVERLSAINELFGVAHGDAVLETLGDRLQNAVDHGVAVARIAGDEFAVVGSVAAEIHGVALRDHLLRSVIDPFEIDGQLVDVGLSTAVTVGRRDQFDQLLAMASSKVRDERSLRAQSLIVASGPLDERRAMLDELRDGLGAGEVSPWFQPLVGCHDYGIHGWEALVRWEHPSRGVLSPSRFLGLVALGGLTATMTDRMLADSIRFARRLTDGGFAEAASVHVNMTAPEARRADLADLVLQLLAEHGVSPAALTIEITEQDVPRIDAVLLDNLQRLEDIGVGVAIDDFGTGYSSLSHLLDIRAQELKIDKRFIDGLPDDFASVTLVRAILGLAGGLGLRTVAEGVEYAEQAEFLAANGCDDFQGYLAARAMRADDAMAFIESWNHTAPVAGQRSAPPWTV
jgi:diguanylate cyclase (GGDEF)-like protein